MLNFAVAAYSPMQRLDVLRRKVLAFHPDLVIYSATTLDMRLMEIHLCEMLRKNVDLKYDFISQASSSLASIDKDDVRLDRVGDLLNKDRLKKKLRPHYWWLYDVTLGAVAAECRVCRRAARDGDHPAGGQGRRPRGPGRAGGDGSGPSADIRG